MVLEEGEEKTPEEVLADHKAALLDGKVAENKRQQQAIIASCTSHIEEYQTQISKLLKMRADAQNLLEELHARYPDKEVIPE